MRKFCLSILLILAALLAVLDLAVLAFVLIWLTVGHGYVACGRGIFDGPGWLIPVLFLVGIPTFILVCALKLARYCFGRLAFRKTHSELKCNNG
jgi:membrane protein implicated in regulation of membrane protease activity